MVSKRRSRRLSNARAARQYQSVKKLRTDTRRSNPTNLNHNENDIPGYHSESDSEPELFLPPDLSTTQSTTLKWERKADTKLRGGRGAGSQSIKTRQLRNVREFQK